MGMNLEHSVVSAENDELEKVVSKLLSTFPKARVFAFYGELGAGKTTLIKSICKMLGVSDTVTSPTFAIINVYNSTKGEIYHFDFYRIKTVAEIFDIGYEEYFYSNNWCFIEWPEKIEAFLPEHTVKVQISVNPQDGSRTFVF